MAGVKHTKVLVTPDDGAEDKAYGVDWNDEHALSDVASQASLDAVSNAVSVVSQALSVEIVDRTSADNLLSNAVSVVSNALSVETAARVAKDDVLSQAVSVVSQALSVLSNTNSAEHAALSVRIDNAGGGGSVTSAELVAGDNAVSAQAASALSQALSVLSVADAALSNKISATSAALSERASALSQAISVVSNAVSVLSQANSVAHAAMSNALSAANATISNLTSAHNVLSNRVSANSGTGGAASVTSNELSAVSAQAASAISQEISVRSAADAALSDRIDAIPGGGSARDRANYVSTAESTATSVLANISGLSMSVSAGGLYQMEARLMLNRANTSTIIGLGLTFPAMKRVRGAINVMLSTAQAVGTVSSRPSNHMFTGDSASGSTIASVLQSSITFLSTMAMISGVFFVSTGGTIQLQAKGSATGGGGIMILEGSYIRVIRIN